MPGKVVDLGLVFFFLRQFVKPFDKWEAFKYGIIDEKGKVLRKRKTLKTSEEKKSFGLYDVLILNMKKLLAIIPGGGSRLGTFSAALLLLLKEDRLEEFEDNEDLLREALIEVMELQGTKQTLAELREFPGDTKKGALTKSISGKDLDKAVSKFDNDLWYMVSKKGAKGKILKKFKNRKEAMAHRDKNKKRGIYMAKQEYDLHRQNEEVDMDEGAKEQMTINAEDGKVTVPVNVWRALYDWGGFSFGSRGRHGQGSAQSIRSVKQIKNIMKRPDFKKKVTEEVDMDEAVKKKPINTTGRPNATYRTETDADSDNFMRTNGDWKKKRMSNGRIGVWYRKANESVEEVKKTLKQVRERDYKREYEDYHGKPDQVKRRTGRNAARRLMAAKAPIKKDHDIHHKDNDPTNNNPSNLAVQHMSINRAEPRLRGVTEAVGSLRLKKTGSFKSAVDDLGYKTPTTSINYDIIDGRKKVGHLVHKDIGYFDDVEGKLNGKSFRFELKGTDINKNFKKFLASKTGKKLNEAKSKPGDGEIWESPEGTMKLEVRSGGKIYGSDSQAGFDFERKNYREAKAQLKKWGYKGPVGWEGAEMKTLTQFREGSVDQKFRKSALSLKDLEVINAFRDGKDMAGKRLNTDGKSLDIVGMGGSGAATIKNGKITIHDLGSRSAAVLGKTLKSIFPRNDFVKEDVELEEAKKVPKFKVGDEVKYARSFLKSSGMITGKVPFMTGKVTRISRFSEMQLVSVIWDEGTKMDILAVNLVLKSRTHLEEAKLGDFKFKVGQKIVVQFGKYIGQKGTVAAPGIKSGKLVIRLSHGSYKRDKRDIRKLEEDAPANASAGGENVAGLDDNPPGKKKKKKKDPSYDETAAGRKVVGEAVSRKAGPAHSGSPMPKDGRPRGGAHLENVRFWKLPADQLRFIIKDAGQAVKANPDNPKNHKGPGNYADQINDAGHVLWWRKKKGIKEDTATTEAHDRLVVRNPTSMEKRRAAFNKILKKDVRKKKSVKEDADTFMGCKVFNVTMDEFVKTNFGKVPQHRYSKYVASEEIRAYGRANPGKGIIVRDDRTQAMMYLRRPKEA